MTARARLVLGIATALPALLILVFIGALCVWILRPAASGEVTAGTLPAWFLVVLLLQVAGLVEGIALMCYYITDIVRNPRVDRNGKIWWTTVMAIAGIFVMPVYWYLYIWRKK